MENNTIKISMLIVLIALAFFTILTYLEPLTITVFEYRWDNRFVGTYYYEFFLGLLVFIMLTFFIFLTNNIKLLKIWIIKGFLVTLVLMLFYESTYHGMDTYFYAMRAFVREFPASLAGSGTENIASINSYFTYLVGNSYYSLKIINSFIGFLGLILLYKTYEYIVKKSELSINDNFIYFFFLFPTVLFWSSILGKDPLNLFFIGLFSYGFIHLIDNFKLKYIFMIVISVWFVSYIRSWWSIIMVTSIFFYYLKINSARNFFLFILVMPIFIVLAMQFLQTQGISSIDQMFLKMTETSQNLAYGGSSVGVYVITGFGDYLIYFIPNLFTTLFRPMPWDIQNAFTLIAAIENMVLFYLFYKYILKHWRTIYANQYLKFYILLILSWSLLYVIISPTNLGMAVRFKLQVLPMMLILIGVSKSLMEQKEE